MWPGCGARPRELAGVTGAPGGLRRQALELGLAHRCQWLGFLEGEAKWQALQGADWFVLPSASENFGIAVIEALAAGTPAILSPEVAVASAIARAGAGLVCSSEPRTLAATLADALAGPSVSMCQAAVELAASDYSWPVIAAQLENAYSTLSR
jgi:glycosyltransferase involved in cell wall biosynthesis